MADYSTTPQQIFSSQNNVLYQTTSGMDESYSDLPQKPNQTIEKISNRILQRKNSEQILKAINSKINIGSIANNQLPQAKDTHNVIVKNISLNDSKTLLRSSSSSYLANTQVGTHTTSKEKRTSINSYNKRVVELNLHQGLTTSQSQSNTMLKNQLSGISSIPVSACNSKQVSIDMSDLKHDSHKLHEVKKMLANRTDKDSQLIEESVYEQVKLPKKSKITVHISPKNQTLKSMLHSPRFSVAPIASIGGSGMKSKLVIKKSASKLQLNKSDQLVFSPGSLPMSQQHRDLSYRSNSPNMTGKALSSINKKQTTSLRKNTSQEKALRNCVSTQDLKKDIQPLSMKEGGYLRIKVDNKKDTIHYSPNAMSINKALSRISSVGEIKRVKDEIMQQRKSIQHNGTQRIAQCMQDRKTGDGIIHSQNNSIKQQEQQVFSEAEDDNEYLTNQEKLWNAIESKQNINVIKELLKREDVKVDAKNVFDDGWTALHYAVNEGYLEVVKILIDNYYASIDVRTAFNKTPFHFACRRGNEDVIKYLIDKGASTSVVDRDGCTPLHYLCENENIEMIKLLLPLCKGCKDVRNRFGKKPVDMLSNSDMKKTLRQYSQQRQSTSRSKKRDNIRSKSRENQIQIHKVNDESSGMQQLFSKFALYKKQRHYQQPKNEDKNFLTVEKCLTKDSSKVKLLGSPSQQNLSINSKQLLSSRPSVSSSQGIASQLKLPQSCKNVQKTQSGKTMFAFTNQKPTSPTKPKQLFNYAKHSQAKKILEVKQTCKTHRGETYALKSNRSKAQLNNSNVNTQLNESKQIKIDNITKQIDQILTKKKIQQPQQKQKHLLIELDGESDSQGEEIDESTVSEAVIKPQVQNKPISQKEKATSEAAMLFASGQTGDSSNHLYQNQDSVDQTNDPLPQDDDTPKDEIENNSNKVGPWSFIAHQLLGTGSFGEVYLVEKISNGKFYAMKVLTKAKIMGHNLTRYAMTERNVLSIADHPFIVKLNYAFQTSDKLFLILDYCPGGDLAEYLQLEKKFNEDKTRLYISEILLAIEELHRKDIIFRDLKPDNVVLDSEGHALLTDFGLSKEGVMQEGMAKSFCGSYAYLAPEMLRKIGHGKAVDWYLLGVVMYEMLCGIPPYYANNKDELFKNIKDSPLSIPSYVSTVAKDLIIKLMNRNPKKRLGTIGGAEEIKKHAFFKNIDWDKMYKRMYRPPEPYLRKRFDNFLQMGPALQTNVEVYETLRKYTLDKNAIQSKDEQHVSGWSFVSPQKPNE